MSFTNHSVVIRASAVDTAPLSQPALLWYCWSAIANIMSEPDETKLNNKTSTDKIYHYVYLVILVGCSSKIPHFGIGS